MKTLREFEFPYTRKYRSVTSLISSIQEPFDREGISERVAVKRGLTQAEVLAEWDQKGAESRQLGTQVHEYIYGVLNGQGATGLERFSARLPHFDQFDQFWEGASRNYEVVWTEKSVSSPVYRVGGRLDTLLYNPRRNTYHVVDWKTGEMDSQGWNRLYPPFNDLMDSKVTLGALQLAVYNLIIKTETQAALGESYLVYISDNNCQVKAVEDYQDRVERWLREGVAEKALP